MIVKCAHSDRRVTGGPRSKQLCLACKLVASDRQQLLPIVGHPSRRQSVSAVLKFKLSKMNATWHGTPSLMSPLRNRAMIDNANDKSKPKKGPSEKSNKIKNGHVQIEKNRTSLFSACRLLGPTNLTLSFE